MLSKLHRFHGHTALNFAHKQGQVIRGTQFNLKYALNARRSDYRVAVVVSKKVSKSAVTRNRIRRRIYEALRQYGPLIVKPYDLIFMVYSVEAATAPSELIIKSVEQQLKKAGVI